MTVLTDDERTVLMIAAEGESMMAVARWEKPIESLVAKGLMCRHDKFNHVITPEGREAIKGVEDEPYRQMLDLGVQIRNAREQARQLVEQAANHLVLAARASSVATGETHETSAMWLNKNVLERALALLK